MAESVITDSGVIMVPAFVGLGAPYWDDKCRGALFGITRGTTPEDITKATLESLAYQTKDVISAMEQDCDTSIETLKVDGGAAMNDYLMQFQSDILQCNVIRPVNVETTALGAAHLAGLAVGFWKDTDELETSDESSKTYEPSMEKEKSEHLYDRWKLAVSAARMFPTE
jgi:glycerol kinase